MSIVVLIVFIGFCLHLKSRLCPFDYIIQGDYGKRLKFSLIQLNCLEVYQLRIEDAVDGQHARKRIIGDVMIDREHHDVHAFAVGFAHLHGRDVDARLAHDGADRSDDAGFFI